MDAIWIIAGNHIALKNNFSVYHPTAAEIYSFDGNTIKGIPCKHPLEELPIVSFSAIGLTPQIRIANDSCGNICLDIVVRKGDTVLSADVIDGRLIDHCIVRDRWYYLTGTNATIQDILNDAGIVKTGIITLRQYIKVIERSPSNFIDNRVEDSALRRPVIESTEMPSGLKATLYPYQIDGFLWIRSMLESGNGCILGDEMGLGKTMQVIAEMLYLKSVSKTPILVVAPISLLENWQRECSRFAPSLNTHIHHGSDRFSNYRDLLEFDVIITSYTTVVSDIHMLNMICWQLVVLDEAQNIKNPYSARTRTCKSINRLSSLAVSGTPFENHISDIWSLVDFIQPNLLGTLQSFESSVSDDIEGGKKIEPILSALMIRRLVANVAQDLPEKVISSQPLQMSELEADQYRSYVESLKLQYDLQNPNLGMLQQLRIFCTHPNATAEGNLDYDPSASSVKYQRFCEIVEEIVSRNEKVIVFTSYKKMFDIFLRDIPLRFGIKAWSINGETPIVERQVIVDKFNKLDSPAVLFLNPKAAGTGLNITGANHVIHYNLEWNPSLEDQASARAYRRGQKRIVFVYRLYYLNTVEEVMNERVERKREISAKAVIGNDGSSQDRADILMALTKVPNIMRK